MCLNIHPKQLYDAQGGRCFHCNEEISPWSEIPNVVWNPPGWTREHFIPKSYLRKMKGVIKYNIVLACGKCNRKRGNRFPTLLEVRKFYSIYKRIL